MAGVEQFLEVGRRLGKGKLASYLAIQPQQVGAGICLAVTAAYLVQAVTLSGRLETPLTALDNLEIKLPFIRSQFMEQQERWEQLVQEEYDTCMSKALEALYQMLETAQYTAVIDPHHAAQSAGYAGLTGGLRSVLSGSMVFNAANPIQLAMLCCRNQEGLVHSAACAKSGNVFYLFDCDYGIFVLPDSVLDGFIRDYHHLRNIACANIGGVMRI